MQVPCLGENFDWKDFFFFLFYCLFCARQLAIEVVRNTQDCYFHIPSFYSDFNQCIPKWMPCLANESEV